MATLVQKALAEKSGRQYFASFSDEEIDLAVAWLDDKVRDSQVAAVMPFTVNNSRQWLAGALKAARLKGRIRIK